MPARLTAEPFDESKRDTDPTQPGGISADNEKSGAPWQAPRAGEKRFCPLVRPWIRKLRRNRGDRAGGRCRLDDDRRHVVELGLESTEGADSVIESVYYFLGRLPLVGAHHIENPFNPEKLLVWAGGFHDAVGEQQE